MEYILRISGNHYDILKDHLLSADSKENVAIGLCGSYKSRNVTILLLHKLTLIQTSECFSRGSEHVKWSTGSIHPYFDIISKSNLSIIKFHSHPGGERNFSETDNASDLDLFSSAFGWSKESAIHASSIMLPNGEILGRIYDDQLVSTYISKISIVGDTILDFNQQVITTSLENGFGLRTAQTFGENTYSKLKRLKVGVIGCSGTGSIVVEQLVRLGVKDLVLIDPDIIEKKNLNRILNSKISHVAAKKFKVLALEEAIDSFGLNTRLSSYPVNLFDDINALRSLIECDVIFGCTDSVDSRHLLNQLCSFYLLPYFDIGVKLIADGYGGISKICGSVHYIQPFKSSLFTRGVYNLEDLRASSQFRKNPLEYEHLRKNSYISNVNVDNPAVISVNMMIASCGINEFLNRIHPYKGETPDRYACVTIDITESYIINSSEDEYPIDSYLISKSGRGDMNPFIEMPEINDEKN